MLVARTALVCTAAMVTLNAFGPVAFADTSPPHQLGAPVSPVTQPGGLAADRHPSSAVAAPGGGRWSAPTTPLRLAAPFDPPALPWLPGHRGVDLTTRPGQVVYAAGSGRIAFAGIVAGRPVLAIDHGRLRTTYEPVLSRHGAGDRVVAGEPVGVIDTGTGHCGDGDCLHLGLRRGAQYLNPLLIIGHRLAVLRPW